MKRNNSFTLVLLAGLILLALPLISAATDTVNVDDVFRVNQIVNYAKPCFNNGTYCSASSICNYTIQKPDNTFLVRDTRATNNISNHNITVAFTDLGIHKIDMTCSDTGRQGAETFYAEITGSGRNDNTSFYLIILGISFGIIIFGFWIKDAPVVILGSFGLYFVGIEVLRFGIDSVKNLQLTWAIGIILLGLAAYISIRSAHEIITQSE